MQNEKNAELRQAMRHAGMTFEALAETLGMSQATVYRMLAADLPEEDVQALLKIIESYEKGKNG